MKQFIILATLTLFSWALNAESQSNQVQFNSCGKNTFLPKPNELRVGYISQVCKISIVDIGQPEPIYSIEYVTNADQPKTYAYAHVYTKPRAARINLVTQLRAVTIGLRIIGSVDNGIFNRILFVREPDADELLAYVDKNNNVVKLSGQMQSLESEVPYKLRITRFKKTHPNW